MQVKQGLQVSSTLPVKEFEDTKDIPMTDNWAQPDLVFLAHRGNCQILTVHWWINSQPCLPGKSQQKAVVLQQCKTKAKGKNGPE